MLRPICTISFRIADRKSKEFVRTKVIYSKSLLKPSEKLKLWNKETKELFGPLLETSKQKKQRLRKAAKNSNLHQNNGASGESLDKNGGHIQDGTQNIVVNPAAALSAITQVESYRMKMLQSTRPYVNLFGCLFNHVPVRGLKSGLQQCAARSSPAEPGYTGSEDKILQIRQHQNDYAKQYPSVTLILNKTMTGESKTALEKWKQERIAEIGLEEFNKFYEAQMAVGTKFHSTLKNYFTQPRSQLRIDKDVEGVWNSVSELLKNISSPKAIESNVVHPILKYRGIFDAIADYEDKPMLIEWKKSDRPRKSIALTYDNPVQLAAYFGAVSNDLNYKHLKVRDALLVIAYTDGSRADTYHLSTDRLREHWAQWLIRLETFMKTHDDSAEKILKGGKRLFEEDIGNLQ